MKTKHTKGEWLNLGYRVDVDVADGMSGICEMSDWMPEEEMEANAKLIAAAPELLNACLAAKAMYEAQGINVNSRIGGEQYSELLLTIQKATE